MLVIRGDVHAATDMLGGIQHRLEDERQIGGLLGDLLTSYEEDVFATQGGGTWAPLAEATVRAKGHSRIMVDHGDLLAALTGGYKTSGDDVFLTAPAYAGALRAGARGMPRRNPTPAPPSHVVDEWAHDLLDHLLDHRGGGR